MFAQYKNRFFSIAFSLVILLIILIINVKKPNWLIKADAVFYDMLVSKTKSTKPDEPKVVIIDIDDASVKKEGRWPWARDKMSILLDKLHEQGVKFTLFDIVFSEPEINAGQYLIDKITSDSELNARYKRQLVPLLDEIKPFVDNDMRFAFSLSADPSVLSYLFTYDDSLQNGELPKPLMDEKHRVIDATSLLVPEFKGYRGVYNLFFENNSFAGFVSNTPDLDAVIRHSDILGQFNHKLYANSVLASVMYYLGADSIELKTHQEDNLLIIDGLYVKDIFIPTSAKGQILIPYWGLPGTVDYYSASDVLEGRLAPNTLKDNIALVGSSMLLLADLHPSPIFQTFPGVEINANMLIGILSQQLAREFDWNRDNHAVIIVVVGFIMILLLSSLNLLLMLVLSLLNSFLIIASSYFLYFYYHLYVSPAILLLLVICLMLHNFSYDFFLERRQKNRIKMLFGQYVPETYVKNIIERANQVSMEGETRDMTVFFADIRNFTALSESLNAAEVKRLLNAFFTPVTDIIFAHQGTIDKYVGDMIMAFWGAPLVDPLHKLNALRAVLSIRHNLKHINEGLVRDNLPSVSIGMGLASGLMNVGDMGSTFRLAYTVIGDTVNLSSRLQDLTKYYQIDIIVSEMTRQGINEILWRTVDKIAVKGRSQATIIYEPLCFIDEVSEELRSELVLHEEALAAYFQREWHIALQLFYQLNRAYPNTTLYHLFITRIEAFIVEPPPPDWQGVFVHARK